MTTPKRLTDKAKPWIIKILKELSPEETITWELTVDTFPDPSATAFNDDSTDLSDSVGLLPALVVYLEVDGIDPKTSIYGATIVAPFQLNEKLLRTALTDLHTQLIDQRKDLTKQQEIDDNRARAGN